MKFNPLNKWGELNPRWIIATILQNWHFYCVLNDQGFSLWQWYQLMHIYTWGKLSPALCFVIMIYRVIPIEETFAIWRFAWSGYIFSLMVTLRQDLGNQWRKDAISPPCVLFFYFLSSYFNLKKYDKGSIPFCTCIKILKRERNWLLILSPTWVKHFITNQRIFSFYVFDV